MNNVQLRAAGLLLARMGAAVVQIADAQERGDPEAAASAGRDVLRYIAAMAEVGYFPEETMAEVSTAVRGIVEEFLVPPPEAALTQEQVDALVEEGCLPRCLGSDRASETD